MKFTFFLLLLTTFAAIALGANYNARGTIKCTGGSCTFIVTIDNGKTFTGTSKSSPDGNAKISGSVSTDSLRNLYLATTGFQYELSSSSATIDFIDKYGTVIGTFNGGKDTPDLTGHGDGDGNWA